MRETLDGRMNEWMNDFINAPKGFLRNNLQKKRRLIAGDIWLL